MCIRGRRSIVRCREISQHPGGRRNRTARAAGRSLLPSGTEGVRRRRGALLTVNPRHRQHVRTSSSAACSTGSALPQQDAGLAERKTIVYQWLTAAQHQMHAEVYNAS